MSLDRRRSTKILFDIYFSLKSIWVHHLEQPCDHWTGSLMLWIVFQIQGFYRAMSQFSLYLYDPNKAARHGPDNLENPKDLNFRAFILSLSMDNPLCQIELLICCRAKSDVSTSWRATEGSFSSFFPFWLSNLCWQMSSEYILINRMNTFSCCKGGRFS